MDIMKKTRNDIREVLNINVLTIFMIKNTGMHDQSHDSSHAS